MSTEKSLFKSNISQKNKVFTAEPPYSSFSDTYLKIRSKEQRVYSDDIVKQLPDIQKDHPHFNEWKKRQKTAKRFLSYLSKNHFSKLLEIGCGNGWFSNMCTEYVDYTVGIDINMQELEQAAKVFDKKDIDFVFLNILQSNPFNEKFDIIVLNAGIQYFEDIDLLFLKIGDLLNPFGEIHILDSPFYHEDEINNARSRTETYYASAGVEEMSLLYHHHKVKLLQDFDVLFKPKTNIFSRILNKNESPFCWYRKKLIQ